MLGAVSRRPKDGHGPLKGAASTGWSRASENADEVLPQNRDSILMAPKLHYSKADKEDLSLSTLPHFSAFLQISKERVKPKSKSGEEAGARNFQPYLLCLSAPHLTHERCNLAFQAPQLKQTQAWCRAGTEVLN